MAAAGEDFFVALECVCHLRGNLNTAQSCAGNGNMHIPGTFEFFVLEFVRQSLFKCLSKRKCTLDIFDAVCMLFQSFDKGEKVGFRTDGEDRIVVAVLTGDSGENFLFMIDLCDFVLYKRDMLPETPGKTLQIDGDVRHIESSGDVSVHFCLHIVIRVFVDEKDLMFTLFAQQFRGSETSVSGSDDGYGFHETPFYMGMRWF